MTNEYSKKSASLETVMHCTKESHNRHIKECGSSEREREREGGRERERVF